MSSNVIVKSNVYVNPSGRRDDPVFLTHITDYRVLKRYESHGGLIRTDAWMTPTQRQILELGQPKCAYEKGSMSWGVPVGGTEMVCRCEQYDCHRYSICSQAYNFQPIKREKATEVVESAPRRYSFLPLYPDLILNTSPEATESKEEKHEITEAAVPVSSENSETASIIAPEPDLGIKHEESSLLATKSSSLDEKKSEIIETETIDAGNSELVDQETIIQAPIHSRIWVNAGPGTGKTYTVIKRIRFLLENENDGTILVLCFSRNAVQEIRTRLTAEIGHKVSYLIEDGALIIRTFDSFASYMLEDELNTAWDYDERIEAFIRTIKQNKSELDNMFDYLIVDELQDTVGVRARMLLELMNSVSCGVLLLGDRCQAIFDWTIRDQDDMTFEQLAGKLNHTSIRRYELEGNRRQERKLDQMGQQLRTTMLEKNEQEQEAAVNQFKDWIRENWKSYELSGLSQVLSGSSDLVLCKTNGEASYVSQELFDSAAQIEHIMKQSSRHRALAAWIAKVLYGNDGQYIDHVHFMKNADDYCVDDPDKKWKILKDLDGHPHAEVIHIPEVLAALTHTDSVPEECISHHDGAAIVSTVHRAKGSEAEHVYWVDSPLVYENHADQEGTLGDAIKAAYVAVTRAKKDEASGMNVGARAPDPA